MAAISLGSSPATVGLDIGSDHIRLAQVRQSGNSVTLTGYATAGVPIGAVVEGEIVDVEAVAGSIRDLMRNSGLRPKNCAIGLSNQKVVVRLIELPFMERTELQGAIQYQAQDYIPIPIEDAILDFQIIGDYMTSSDEHMMEVVLVAAQRDMVGNAVRAVEESGLKLQQIDVTSFAIVRALNQPMVPSVLPDDGEDGSEATGIIHISSGLTNIAVVERGVPRFTRVSSLAGDQFTQAIANTMNLTFDEAEDLKVRLGLPDMDQREQPAFPADLDPAKAQQAHDALEREVSKFIGEVRRSLDYYLTQATQVRTIRKILLTGSGAMLQHLPRYLEKGLQAEVAIADPLELGPGHAAVQREDRGRPSRVGGRDRPGNGGSGINRINLLPPEIIQKRKDEKRWRWVALGTVGAVSVLIAAFLILQVEVSLAETDLAAIKQQVAGLKQNSERFKVFQDKKSELASRQNIADQAKSGRIEWANLCGDLALVTPTDIYLLRIEASEPAAKVAAAPGVASVSSGDDGIVTIDGRALDYPDDVPDLGYKSVAKMIVRLAELGQLNNIWMTKASRNGAANPSGGDSGSFIEFTITAKVTSPPTSTPAPTVSSLPGQGSN